MALLFAVAGLALAAGAVAAEPRAHTYSIVARDPATGELGVAVQSHWFGVGRVVAWAEAGVGAVATQSFVRVEYGPRGLDALRAGAAPDEALERLLAGDPGKDVRQVAMVDRQGRVAAWTGPRCIAEAGHQTGDGYSVQANLMDRATVWPAMARAYEAAEGGLAERLLAALEAAEAEGGDIRGQQSAALLVVRGESTGRPWEDRLVDLRVDDHPEPLAELRRLLRLHRAYESADRGDEAMAAGDVEAALERYRHAAELAPEVVELPFWQAVTLYSACHEEEALALFRRVFAAEERWARLVPRLPAAGLLPGGPEAVERILSGAPGAGDASPEAGGGEEETGDEEDEMSEETNRWEGTLTDEGIECQAMRGTDGELYTLTGDLEGFTAGDQVWVEGEAAAMSICMQGTTIAVERIGRRE